MPRTRARRKSVVGEVWPAPGGWLNAGRVGALWAGIGCDVGTREWGKRRELGALRAWSLLPGLGGPCFTYPRLTRARPFGLVVRPLRTGPQCQASTHRALFRWSPAGKKAGKAECARVFPFSWGHSHSDRWPILAG